MPRDADPLDEFIGKRIRLLRRARRMSLATLGKAIGVAGQQVSKYERSVDRVQASRLYRIAVALDSPISFFFEQAIGSKSLRTKPMFAYWRRRRQLRARAEAA
jgi:transcriptional regulator with XRE-family HTH domain